jgi:hypothetical protein
MMSWSGFDAIIDGWPCRRVYTISANHDVTGVCGAVAEIQGCRSSIDLCSSAAVVHLRGWAFTFIRGRVSSQQFVKIGAMVEGPYFGPAGRNACISISIGLSQFRSGYNILFTFAVHISIIQHLAVGF